jgi:NADH:ubiquinone oxidoreductase subunit 4 (subunit M)
MFIISISILINTIYSFWLYNRIFFGNLENNIYIFKYSDINKREFFVLLSLIFLIILIGCYPNFLLEYIHNSLYFILYFIIEC